MKELINYGIRNFFLEKSYTKFGGETYPRSFSISLDQQSGILYKVFLLYFPVED